MSNRKNSLATLERTAQRASEAVAETDDRLTKARQAITQLHERAQPLRDQIAELAAEAPTPVGPSEAHIEALLADPSARPDQGEITAMISAARKQDDVRGMTIATVQAAIGRMDEEVASVQAEIDELNGLRVSQWGDFACAAGEYLSTLFLQKFEQLRDEVMMPLVALPHIRGADGKTVLPVTARVATLSFDRGAMALRRYDCDASAYVENKLFEMANYMNPDEAAGLVSRFRDALPASASSDSKSS